METVTGDPVARNPMHVAPTSQPASEPPLTLAAHDAPVTSMPTRSPVAPPPPLEKMLVKGEDNPFTSIVFEAHTFYVE